MRISQRRWTRSPLAACHASHGRTELIDQSAILSQSQIRPDFVPAVPVPLAPHHAYEATGYSTSYIGCGHCAGRQGGFRVVNPQHKPCRAHVEQANPLWPSQPLDLHRVRGQISQGEVVQGPRQEVLHADGSLLGKGALTVPTHHKARSVAQSRACRSRGRQEDRTGSTS
eukprot:COSAG01_NODE_451_length_16883_cov_55.881733_1_plen_170_part_00